MNTAEQVNNYGTWCRILGGFVLAEEHIGKKYAKARARIGLQHVENGFAMLQNLSRSQRGKDTMINSVVQEENLGWFNEYSN